VNDTLQALEDGGCLRVNEDNTVESLVMGTVASQYYLHYTTVALFSANIRADTSLEVDGCYAGEILLSAFNTWLKTASQSIFLLYEVKLFHYMPNHTS
jgi:hypothetical protein